MIGVNALACGGKRVEPPESEPRPWTTYLAVPTRAPAADEQLDGRLEPVWNEDAGRSVVGPVAVGELVVVAQASDRKLTLWDRATGARLWRQNLGAPGASGPLFTAERVYAAAGGDDGEVAAYDLSTGRRDWHREVGPVVGTIALGGGRVFAATRAGHLVALDATEGEIVWRRAFPGSLRAGVTVVGPNLLVATDDSLYLVSRYEGEIVASQQARGTVVSAPAVAPGTIVTTSPAGWIASYDAETLAPGWRVEIGAPVFGSPAVARDTAFATALDGTLWRIPLADPAGRIVDSLGLPMRAGPTPVRNGVLVASISGDIVLLGRDPAAPVWQAQIDGPVEEPVTVYRGFVAVADGFGEVRVWKEGE